MQDVPLPSPAGYLEKKKKQQLPVVSHNLAVQYWTGLDAYLKKEKFSFQFIALHRIIWLVGWFGLIDLVPTVNPISIIIIRGFLFICGTTNYSKMPNLQYFVTTVQ
jgi:hypothetical protein